MSDLSDKLRALQAEADELGEEECSMLVGMFACFEEHEKGECGGVELNCLLCKAEKHD